VSSRPPAPMPLSPIPLVPERNAESHRLNIGGGTRTRGFRTRQQRYERPSPTLDGVIVLYG
jgi:hypothetical protein